MGPHELLAGAFIELVGQPFTQTTTVHEHDGGAVRLDELHDARVDCGPDAVLPVHLLFLREPERAGRLGGLAQNDDPPIRRLDHRAGHVVDGHDDAQIDARRNVRVHDRHGSVAPQKPGHFGGGARGGGQADPLRVLGGEVGQPLE